MIKFRAVVAGAVLVTAVILGLAACGGTAAPRPAVTVTAPATTASGLTPDQLFIRNFNNAWPDGSLTDAQAIGFGHTACTDMESGDGVDGTAQSLASAGVTDTLTATSIIGAAVKVYCPSELPDWNAG
jgi:hypothetical protein